MQKRRKHVNKQCEPLMSVMPEVQMESDDFGGLSKLYVFGHWVKVLMQGQVCTLAESHSLIMHLGH